MRSFICLLAVASALLSPLPAADPVASNQVVSIGIVPPGGQGTGRLMPEESSAIANLVADGHWIKASDQGADINCRLQNMRGTLDGSGLHLYSTSPDDGNTGISVTPKSISRQDGNRTELSRGIVTVSNGTAQVHRAQMTEEISVSIAGIRHDFVISHRPEGDGDISLRFSVTGGTVGLAQDGIAIALDTGRTLRWDRLAVFDTTGKQLPARWESSSATELTIAVDDAAARYPIRIDPTFTDADWGTLGTGTNGEIRAMTIFNGDLYVGGSFSIAGSVGAINIAKWNGSSWSPVGQGLNNTVRTLSVANGRLYAGGHFSDSGTTRCLGIACWDGNQWGPVASGVSGQVYALTSLDSNLYAGGIFTTAGGISAANIARWDGSNWFPLGSGISGSVKALAIMNRKLYAAGSFSSAGGVVVDDIAKWDGSAWTALGSGLGGGMADSLLANGFNLYAGGSFSDAGGVSARGIAKWDGSSWSSLGTGVVGGVDVMYMIGSDLYVGGSLLSAGGLPVYSIAKWNGSAWQALGSGANNTVYALIGYNNLLCVGGGFTVAGGKSAMRIATAAVEFPLAPPVITSSTSVATPIGSSISYQITATNTPISFSASGLPSGLTVNAATGIITGTPSVTGSYISTVTATNASGTGSAQVTFTILPTPPVITSATSASGMVGQVFSYTIIATSSPTSFACSGLPAGLAIDTTSGVISGTPTAAGTSTATISAINAGGTGTATLTISIQPAPPVITSPTTATGLIQSAFTYTIIATGAPSSFGATGLPSGLSINSSTGVISGTPTALGTTAVSISATNAAGTTSATLTITVQETPAITSPLTATGYVGTSFTYTITATGSPSIFSSTGLPSGLMLNGGTGLISGTPTTAGSSSVTVSATTAGGTASATLVITIHPAPVITSQSTVTGMINTPFSFTITASGSPATYGALGLPAGLTLAPSTGVISGTPTIAGTTPVGITVTYSTNIIAGVLNITIDPAIPVLASATSAVGTVGTPFSVQIVASSQPSSYAATGLPAGLTINTTSGVISGIPTVSGTSAVTLSATNSNGTGNGTLSITIQPAVGITLPAVSAAPAAAFAGGGGGGGGGGKCGLGSGLGLLFGGLTAVLWWRRRRS